MRKDAMNKRLEKRHKRQVSRAKQQVKLSEPDLRTPDQIQAAREASRPSGGWPNSRHGQSSMSATRTGAGRAVDSTAKSDG